jgi:hypothetical protein
MYLLATSAAELERALEHARDEEGLVMVEVMTPNVDSAEAVKNYLEACRELFHLNSR